MFLNAVLVELKVSLSSFIEKTTTEDYDREAELALQRLTSGDVDINQLTNAWTRSYVEVVIHFRIAFPVLSLAAHGPFACSCW